MRLFRSLPGGRNDGDSVENYYVLSGDQLQSIVQRTVTSTLQQLSLDNLKAEPTGMSEGETDMAKRERERVQIGTDTMGSLSIHGLKARTDRIS